MRRLLFLFFLILLLNPIDGSAQTPQIKVQRFEDIPDFEDPGLIRFVQQDERGHFYVLRTKGVRNKYIDHYDTQRRFVERANIITRKSEFRRMEVVGDSLRVYEFAYSVEKKRYEINLLESPRDGMNFSKRNIYTFDRSLIKKYEIFETRDVNFYRDSFYYESSTIVHESSAFHISDQGSYFGFVFRTQSDGFHIFVFDKDFNFVYDALIDEEKSVYTPVEFKIDDNGSAYLLSKECRKLTKTQKKLGEKRCIHRIYKVDNDLKEPLVHNLNEAYDTVNLILSADDVIAIGLLRGKTVEAGSRKTLKTISKYTISSSDLKLDSLTFPSYDTNFEESSFFDSFFGYSESYGFRRSDVYQNGEILMEIEASSSLAMGENSVDVYGDVLILKLKSDGSTAWYNVIDKYQAGWYGGYISFHDSRSMVYLMNVPDKQKEKGNVSEDEIRNVSLISGFGFKPGSLYYRVFDQNGKQVLEEGIDDRYYNRKIPVNRALRIDDKTVIVQKNQKKDNSTYLISLN